ncbi:MAG TPA: DnaJ family domain-containing protein [Bacillota bacterium]|nr:DnaJ family domain-containing protein [Bacillota bacterium]
MIGFKSKSPTEDSKEGKKDLVCMPIKKTWIIMEIVRNAKRDGHFDDLPGKGKPLDMWRGYMNPFAKQLYKMLKSKSCLAKMD